MLRKDRKEVLSRSMWVPVVLAWVVWARIAVKRRKVVWASDSHLACSPAASVSLAVLLGIRLVFFLITALFLWG